MSRAGWLWLTVLLVAPATSAAPYLQPGADAARTGVTGDEGPLHDEVALRVAVPGTRAPGSVPLIHERFVYVLVQASDHQAHDTNGVVRVSLDTGEVRTLVETRSPPLNGAMAPDRILVILDGEVAAFGTADGQALWTWPLPVLVGTPTWHTRCLPPAMQGSSVVVACGEIGQTLRDALGVRDEPVGSLASVTPEVALFVASLDVVTGKLQWLTQLPLAQDAPATPSRPRTLSAFQDSILPGFAVLQHHVVVLAEELMASDVSLTQVWLLDAADGSPVWGRALPGGTTDPARAAPSGPEEVRPNRIYGDPTGSDDEFYVALRELIAFDPRDPEPSWTQPLDRSSPNAVGGTALALRAPALYVASDDTLRRIDTTSRTVQWTHVLPPGE
ncbi:MAG TPA: PQQ-binding-like beta-propeller repeat protein, partial [Nitriliruptorales bacterium]